MSGQEQQRRSAFQPNQELPLTPVAGSVGCGVVDVYTVRSLGKKERD
jgi:hypothetical protein